MQTEIQKHSTAPTEAIIAFFKASRMPYWRTRDAIKEYTNAIEIFPEYSYAYYNRGLLYRSYGEGLMSSYWGYVGKTYIDKAEADFLEVIRINNENFVSLAYNQLGNIYHTQSNYTNALYYYTIALNIDPSLSTAKDNINKIEIQIQTNERQRTITSEISFAYAKFHNGDFTSAIIHFNNVLRLDPNNREARNGLPRAEKGAVAYEIAVTSFTRGDYANAIAQYRIVLELIPNNTDAKKNLNTAWNNRIEANSNLYPAPFQGTWYHNVESITGTTPGRTIRGQVQSRTYIDPWGRTVTETRRDRDHIIPGESYTIPGGRVVYQFDGINYTYTGINITTGRTERTKTGTFFYSDDTIEFDDGSALMFLNNEISSPGGKVKFHKQ